MLSLAYRGETRQTDVLDEAVILVFDHCRQTGAEGRYAIFFASPHGNRVANGFHGQYEGRAVARLRLDQDRMLNEQSRLVVIDELLFANFDGVMAGIERERPNAVSDLADGAGMKHAPTRWGIEAQEDPTPLLQCHLHLPRQRERSPLPAPLLGGYF